MTDFHSQQIYGPGSALKGVRCVAGVCLGDPSVYSASHRSDLEWLGERREKVSFGTVTGLALMLV